MSIQYKTIKELSIMLKNNDISNKELISETYSLIKSKSHLNAFITLNEDDAITVSYTHLTLPTKRIV